MRPIKTLSADDRPREKLVENGSRSLSNAELLAILIGSGNKEMNAVELSRHILQKYENDLARLAKCEVSDLTKYKGIGQAKAITLVAAMELARRKMGTTSSEKPKITSSQEAFQLAINYVSDVSVEEFWAIYLSRSNRVLSAEQISKGGIHSTVVDNRIVLKKALSLLATGIIVFHNHPSGGVTPSKQDISLTKKLKTACETVDLKLLDHLIIGQQSYFSFADEQML